MFLCAVLNHVVSTIRSLAWRVIFFQKFSYLLPFFVCNTGAENGSSSHGGVGQSGSVAGSTGGVSKASKGQGSTDKDEQAGNQKRARRQWESWSAEDKNSFFEGLYEVKKKKSIWCANKMEKKLWSLHPLHNSPFQHGKDFEAIQNNIAMKYKKRGKPANMVKNKEQVRHFYYRTWHKISKHIDFANGKISFHCLKEQMPLNERQYLFFLAVTDINIHWLSF